jgi:hypothetical protein
VGDNPANGVYFIDEQGNRTQVDVSDIVINKPSELMIMVPSLPAGMYRIEVTTQYAVSSLLKDSRTTTFDKILTVI